MRKRRSLILVFIGLGLAFSLSAQVIQDQVQQEVDYGYWFDFDTPRWQEFIPTLDNIAGVEIYVHAVGSAGLIAIDLRDNNNTILHQSMISADEVHSGWLYFNLYKSTLIPGQKYRINVYTDRDSSDPENRYFWEGSFSSAYDESCVSSIGPEFDFAFRTYGYNKDLVLECDFSNDYSDNSFYASELLTSGSPVFAEDRFGDPVSSLSLDGSSFLTVDDADYLDITDAITISAWIKPISTNLQYIVLKRATINGGGPYSLGIFPGTVRAVLYDESLNLIADIEGSTPIVQDAWQHIAFTYDGSTAKVFYNGVLDGSVSASGLIGTSTGDLEIGTYQWPIPPPVYTGELDDIKIYNKGLSEAEILQLYQEGGWPLNHPPVRAQQLPRFKLVEGFGSWRFDIAHAFSDPDGDLLTYSAVANWPDVVTAHCVGSELVVTEVGSGYTYGSVWANDGEASIHNNFKVDIIPDSTHFEIPEISFENHRFYIYSATLDGVDLSPGDEIGIFDGGVCIGAKKITETVTSENFIIIDATKDYPFTTEIDGFQTGNSLNFNVWDSTNQNLYPKCTYYISSGPHTYETGVTYGYLEFFKDEQTIELAENWNIISFAVMPEDANLQSILSPLIQDGSILKIQDEAGNAIEELPAPIGWINNIGDMAYTEGYKVKAAFPDTLTIKGVRAVHPMSMRLVPGWNIMGCPWLNPLPTMAYFDYWVDNNRLIKVQDEAGNAIEELPAPIGWIDNIDTLYPGEGYKVKLAETTKKSAIYSDGLFNPVWDGNGLDHMNIYLYEPTYNGVPLVPGDEIGVYDGDICVGYGSVSEENPTLVELIASCDDPTTEKIDGFSVHSPITLRYRSALTINSGQEGALKPLKGYSLSFKKNGTTVIMADFTDGSEYFLGDAYPNPANTSATFSYGLFEKEFVRIDVINSLGQLVSVLVNDVVEAGSHQADWNLKSFKNQKVESGVYYYRLLTNSFQQTKSIVVIK